MIINKRRKRYEKSKGNLKMTVASIIVNFIFICISILFVPDLKILILGISIVIAPIELHSIREDYKIYKDRKRSYRLSKKYT